jgi:hypothetical protein
LFVFPINQVCAPDHGSVQTQKTGQPQWRCRSIFGSRIEIDREIRYSQRRYSFPSGLSRIPCALLLSSGINTSVGISILLRCWGSSGLAMAAGCCPRGWLGSKHAKQRLERGGAQCSAHPYLAAPRGKGKGLSRGARHAS